MTDETAAPATKPFALSEQTPEQPDPGIALNIAASPEAPAQARTAVSQFAEASTPDDVQERAKLAVSELVTNAVRHGSDESGAIELRLRRDDEALIVEVIDAGKRKPVEKDLAGGYGLKIVSQISDSFRSLRSDAWHVIAEFKPR